MDRKEQKFYTSPDQRKYRELAKIFQGMGDEGKALMYELNDANEAANMGNSKELQNLHERWRGKTSHKTSEEKEIDYGNNFSQEKGTKIDKYI